MKSPKFKLFFTGSIFIAHFAIAQAQTTGMSNTAPAGTDPQNPSGVVTNPAPVTGNTRTMGVTANQPTVRGNLENGDPVTQTTDTTSTGARTDTAMNPDGSVASVDRSNANDRVGMSTLGYFLVFAALVAIIAVAVNSYRHKRPRHA